jgi:imidazolonepropionase-like amidohydrolase
MAGLRTFRENNSADDVAFLGEFEGRSARQVGAMHRAGVGILAGTDTPGPFTFPGSSLHEELALFVDRAGLTPLQALRTATLDAARYLEATDSLGTVAEGKLADLVLLDADPLEDICNTQRIHAVVLNGRLLDQAALDAVLAAVEEAASRNGAPVPTGARLDTVRAYYHAKVLP